jgi:hypothetical protein
LAEVGEGLTDDGGTIAKITTVGGDVQPRASEGSERVEGQLPRLLTSSSLPISPKRTLEGKIKRKRKTKSKRKNEYDLGVLR